MSKIYIYIYNIYIYNIYIYIYNTRDKKQTKKPRIFAHYIYIYFPRQVTINLAVNVRVNTGLEATLPDNLI